MKEHRTEFKKLIEGTITAMGGRSPDDAAMGIWLIALEKFDYSDVREAVIYWASTETTWPRPADISKAIKAKKARAAEQEEASRRVVDEKQRAELRNSSQEVFTSLDSVLHIKDNNPKRDPVYRAKRIKEARSKGWSSVDGVTLLPIHDWWADRVLA